MGASILTRPFPLPLHYKLVSQLAMIAGLQVCQVDWISEFEGRNAFNH